MKTIKSAVLFALAVLLTGIAATVHAYEEQTPDRYFVLKGGRYSPGEKFDITHFSDSTVSELEMRTGSSWEIALGQYADPKLALELGIGYLESRGSAAAQPGSARLKAVPIVVTAKDFMTTEVLQTYVSGGVGAYFTKLDVNGNTGSFTSQSKATYGFHLGLGLNIDFAKKMFIGVEGRYLWVKADYAGQPVKLNGLMTLINAGFSY